MDTERERCGPDRPSAFVPALLCAIALIVDGTDPACASHGAGTPTVAEVRPEHLRRLVDAKANVVLVDLRRPNEYLAGHLPGALSLPIADLEKRYGEIPTAEQVVLYCQCPFEDLVSAFLFLRSRGHANLAVLEEGFDGWLRRRYPIDK